jgi:hypothetical protein
MYSILAIVVWIVQFSLLIYTMSALYPHFNILKILTNHNNFKQQVMNNKKRKSQFLQFILNFLAVAFSLMTFFIAFDSFMNSINELKNNSTTAFLLGFAVTILIVLIEKTKNHSTYSYISPVFIAFTVIILLPALGSNWNSEPMVAGGIGKVLALYIIFSIHKKKLDNEIIMEEKKRRRKPKK